MTLSIQTDDAVSVIDIADFGKIASFTTYDGNKNTNLHHFSIAEQLCLSFRVK